MSGEFTFSFYTSSEAATAYQKAAADGQEITLDVFGKRFDGLKLLSAEPDKNGLYLVTMSASEAVAKLFAEMTNSELHGYSMGVAQNQS